MEKRTITCFLCGGVHIYPGPRFGNHLLHEHGVVFNQEYIISVSQFKDTYSILPPILSRTGLDKFSQTELPGPSCSLCSKPLDDFLSSTPTRTIANKNVKISSPTPSSFLTPKTESLKLGIHGVGGSGTRMKDKYNGRDHSLKNSSVASESELSSLPWLENNSGQGSVMNCEGVELNYSVSSCTLGTKPIKQERTEVAADGDITENTRTMKTNDHQSIQLLDHEEKDKFDQYIKLLEGTDSESQQGIRKHLNHPNRNSKPLNITDKSNKNCSQCDITFPSRILFLRHCQDVHKLKFKNKFGNSLLLGKKTSVVGEGQSKKDKLPVPVLDKKSIPSYLSFIPSPQCQGSKSQLQVNTNLHAKIQSPSLSSTLPPPLPKCQYCKKTFSSKANRDRHVKQSCLQKGLGEQAVQMNDKSVEGSGEGPGFKCSKCDKVYLKLGNLNRHCEQLHAQ